MKAILCLKSTPSFQLPHRFGLGNRLISIEDVNCVPLELWPTDKIDEQVDFCGTIPRPASFKNGCNKGSH